MSEKTIIELKSLWKEENEDYRTVEVGSGVQKFVKEVFKCHQLFNLCQRLRDHVPNQSISK